MAFVETKQSNHKNASTQLVWRGWQSNKLVINFQPTMERAGVGNWGGRVKTITNLEIILTRATELRAIDWMPTAIKNSVSAFVPFSFVYFWLLAIWQFFAVACREFKRKWFIIVWNRFNWIELTHTQPPDWWFKINDWNFASKIEFRDLTPKFHSK